LELEGGAHAANAAVESRFPNVIQRMLGAPLARPLHVTAPLSIDLLGQ
jgi:hypothetical protein